MECSFIEQAVSIGCTAQASTDRWESSLKCGYSASMLKLQCAHNPSVVRIDISYWVRT